MNETIFRAEMDQLHLMLKFIQEYAFTLAVTDSILNKILLASEEALVNIISYAYTSTSGLIKIQCEECHEKKGMVIRLIDKGIPFNPLIEFPAGSDYFYKPNPNLTGGFGIYLYRHIMDEVSYSYQNDQNCLILTKYI